MRGTFLSGRKVFSFLSSFFPSLSSHPSVRDEEKERVSEKGKKERERNPLATSGVKNGFTYCLSITSFTCLNRFSKTGHSLREKEKKRNRRVGDGRKKFNDVFIHLNSRFISFLICKLFKQSTNEEILFLLSSP